MFTALICTRADRMPLTLLQSCRTDLIKLHTLPGESNFTKKCLKLWRKHTQDISGTTEFHVSAVLRAEGRWAQVSTRIQRRSSYIYKVPIVQFPTTSPSWSECPWARRFRENLAQEEGAPQNQVNLREKYRLLLFFFLFIVFFSIRREQHRPRWR